MVHIVILTWNGMKYLPALFTSLAALNYPKYKIVVVDSGSTDGSVEYVEKLDMDVHIIRLVKNLGFVKGNNIGMEYALKNGAEYVVLLNQDIEVEIDFLEKLVKKAESDDKIGVVQPLILYYKDRKEINSTGNLLHYLGYGYCEGNHERYEGGMEDKEITYASAAAVLYKSSMLKEIGLLDENIFAYHEDSEICLRARMGGYTSVLCGEAMVYHDYSFPTDKGGVRYFWMEKNRLYIILKFYTFWTLLKIWPMMIFMDLGQLYFAFRNGYVWQWFRSRLWFMYRFLWFWKARRNVQKSRKIGDREFVKGFVSEIKYQEVANPLLDRIANPIMDKYWKLINR